MLRPVLVLSLSLAVGISAQYVDMFELPYGVDALEPYLERRTVDVHYNGHHKGYAKKLNIVLGYMASSGDPNIQALTKEDPLWLLQNIHLIPEGVRAKVRNNGGGYVNHNMYWQSMSPNGGELHGALQEAIMRTFGTEQKFRELFVDAALSIFGSGYTWLCAHKETGELWVETSANQDTPANNTNVEPLLTLDVWEHAYYLTHEFRRKRYVDNWWNIVNWNRAGEQYESLVNPVDSSLEADSVAEVPAEVPAEAASHGEPEPHGGDL